MIDREYNISDAAPKLAPYLEANRDGYQGFRRRAVLSSTNNEWSLLACTVEAVTNDGKKLDVVASRCYPQVVLYEDWISGDELLDFVRQVSDGRITLGEHSLVAAETHHQWSRDQVPARNIYMNHSGQVFSARFQRSNASRYGALLAPGQPYYPDVTEAGRDWLPFPVYHGESDARNGEVVLLLSETRAYLTEVFTTEELLNLRIAGTQVKKSPFLAKGAWWDPDGMHHFETHITDGYGQVRIPASAARVEFVLTDQTGAIYDYQREYNYGYHGLEWSRSVDENANADLAQIVRDACQHGEGLRVEFKPFIEPDVGSKNEKFKEIVRTVVAYANTKGGQIFLGINNDCELQGIDEKLSKWVKGQPDNRACEKYLGALRGRIRDVVVGEAVIAFKQVVVDGFLIAIIEVTEAREKPVCILQDHSLYVRRGSNNRKAAPDEWKSILGTQELQYPI